MVKFIYDEDDPTMFDALFTQALVYKLASLVAAPLTGKAALTQQMHQLFATSLGDAARVDASEDRDRGDQVDANYYVTARK
jgi:hypothetical protein